MDGEAGLCENGVGEVADDIQSVILSEDYQVGNVVLCNIVDLLNLETVIESLSCVFALKLNCFTHLLSIDESGLVVFETNQAGVIVRITIDIQTLKIYLMIVL